MKREMEAEFDPEFLAKFVLLFAEQGAQTAVAP